MSKQLYDWGAARDNLQQAIAAVFAAVRHTNHRKRMNALKDIDVAMSSLAAARLEMQPTPHEHS